MADDHYLFFQKGINSYILEELLVFSTNNQQLYIHEITMYMIKLPGMQNMLSECLQTSNQPVFKNQQLKMDSFDIEKREKK